MSRARPAVAAGQLDAFDNGAPAAHDQSDASSVAGDFQVGDGSAGIQSGVGELTDRSSADLADGQPLPAAEPLPAGEPLVVRSLWVSLENGEQLHLRHFLPALEPLAEPPAQPEQWHGDVDEVAILQRALAGANGRSVFMLHGEAECGRVFYDSSHRGLARYLARRGYEVFVADLGGRGRSLVQGTAQSTLSVNQLVSEAIPALLRCAARDSVFSTPGTTAAQQGPDVWIAHGFGAVLLSATWARLAEHERCAQQWVFFSGRRRFAARQRWARIFVKLFCHPLSERWVGWRNLFPATRLGLGSADENASWFRTYAHWMHARDWRDSVDEFDYQHALSNAQVPATLHLAAASDEVFSNLEDIREFITELGPHDARLLVVDRIGLGKRRYNHLAMLLDDAAEQDVFDPLDEWLAQASNYSDSAAHAGHTCAAPQSAAYSAAVVDPALGSPALSSPALDNAVERSAPGPAVARESRVSVQPARPPGQHEVEVELYYNRPQAASIATGEQQVSADDVQPTRARAS